MKILKKLYDKVLSWSHKKHASGVLAGLSFAESSFFPIPPDVLLIPLCLGNPSKSLKWYAPLTTISSVLGGVAGYFIGFAIAIPFQNLLSSLHLVDAQHWDAVKVFFDQYGLWAVGIAGFTPVPYKIFTISSGMFGFDLVLFIFISVVSRGLRFFLLGMLIYFFGEKIKAWIDRYFNWLSLAFVVLIILFILLVKIL